MNISPITPAELGQFFLGQPIPDRLKSKNLPVDFCEEKAKTNTQPAALNASLGENSWLCAAMTPPAFLRRQKIFPQIRLPEEITPSYPKPRLAIRLPDEIFLSYIMPLLANRPDGARDLRALYVAMPRLFRLQFEELLDSMVAPSNNLMKESPDWAVLLEERNARNEFRFKALTELMGDDYFGSPINRAPIYRQKVSDIFINRRPSICIGYKAKENTEHSPPFLRMLDLHADIFSFYFLEKIELADFKDFGARGIGILAVLPHLHTLKLLKINLHYENSYTPKAPSGLEALVRLKTLALEPGLFNHDADRWNSVAFEKMEGLQNFEIYSVGCSLRPCSLDKNPALKNAISKAYRFSRTTKQSSYTTTTYINKKAVCIKLIIGEITRRSPSI